jgi:hypothetical protein
MTWVPVGAAVRGGAAFQQEERHVVAAATADVPVHGCHERIQRLVAADGEKRRGDLVVREEVPVAVAAFDQAIGVEQESVAGQPRCGERGEVIF